jgi:hypothetical protein
MTKEFIPGSMDRFLSEVSDPRVKRRQQHILSDILVLTIRWRETIDAPATNSLNLV